MQTLRSVLTPSRALWLNLIVVLGCLTLVFALGWHMDAVRDAADASWVLDRFGHPWFPDFAVHNERMDRLRSVRKAVLWGGVLPSDLSLLGLSAWALFMRKSWPTFFAFLIALAVASLLFGAWLAAVIPSGGMLG